MKVKPITVGGWASNSYLLTDDQEVAGVLVDPAVTPKELPRYVGKHPSISCVVLSHGHFDHITSLAAWQEAGVDVLIGKGDAAALSDPYVNCSAQFLGQAYQFNSPTRTLSEGDVILLGDEEIRVLATPGHTAGGICLLAGDHLICGDTIFANGGIGRYDLPGASFDSLMASIQRIMALPPETRIYPGHGPASTVGNEKRFHSLK